MKKIQGGVCAPIGFKANGVHCGIRKNKEKRFYLSCDIAVLVLCLITKVTVPGNFDISYLLLVVAYFITNRKLKRYTQQQLEARKS